jgi:hypothetical protein
MIKERTINSRDRARRCVSRRETGLNIVWRNVIRTGKTGLILMGMPETTEKSTTVTGAARTMMGITLIHRRSSILHLHRRLSRRR